MNKPTENNKPEKERIRLDEIIKLLFNVSKQTLVNTLNGLFNEQFNSDDVDIKISKTSTEFVPDNLDIIRADSFFKLEAANKPYHYHIEYQLNANDMTIRVFEYAIQKALENKRVDGRTSRKILYLPRSLVIHFEKSDSIPDQYELEIVFPNGDSHEYTIAIMKYWEYTDKKLIDKKLYNLLPLQVFLLRAELDKVMKSNNEKEQNTAISRAKEMTSKIFTVITELHEEHEINSDDYNKIITGLTEIMNHIDNKYNIKLGGEIEMIKTIADENILKRARQAEQALQSEKAKTAKKMLLNNEPIDKIIDYTGLTEQEIQNIQKTL